MRLAINGYGRIGRCVLRALYERGFRDRAEVVAVNDITDHAVRVHLTRHDSTHGPFPFPVEREGDRLMIEGDSIRLLTETDIDELPWRSLGVDIVLDCTGLLHDRDAIARHLGAGAGRVLLSWPGPADVDLTVVYGVNHRMLRASHRMVSNASCTTNCVVPVLGVVDGAFGIERGSVTVIHSMMNDQPLLDERGRPDLRRARGAGRSIVPVETKLAQGIARLLPHLAGRLAASSLRVPVTNVSAMDITLAVSRDTDEDTVNGELARAAAGDLNGVLGVERRPLVSADLNHDARSCVVDAGATRVIGGRLVKVLAWFDNEWAFAVRMLDTACALGAAGVPPAGRDGVGAADERKILIASGDRT